MEELIYKGITFEYDETQIRVAQQVYPCAIKHEDNWWYLHDKDYQGYVNCVKELRDDDDYQMLAHSLLAWGIDGNGYLPSEEDIEGYRPWCESFERR